MNAEPEHQHVPLHYRNLLSMPLVEADTVIEVDHVYIPEGQAGTCCHEGCGKPAHDPGMVGITIIDTSEEEDGSSGVALLTAEQAITIANRLTRAANLVLESGEDVADIEREAARYTETSASQERGAA